MLGGGDTSFGSTGNGGGGNNVTSAVGSSGARDGSSEAGAMVGSSKTTNGGDNNSAGEDDRVTDRSLGGNRWPRQETLALLKIRSDMGVTFRDASVKGPLWEEVSRKLAELGYHRSAKKCKEKFENVYKYHKRTKDGRTGKPDGKTYRFFEQLEALENRPNSMRPPPPPPQLKPQLAPAMQPVAAAAAANNPPNTQLPPHNVTVPSTLVSSLPPQNINPNPTVQPPPPSSPQPPPTSTTIPSSFPNISSTDLMMSNSTASSSSTSSDLELEGSRRKRKRKWKDFFERLMKEVVQKQEEMQKKFLEAIEKREHERMVREDAWRMQEMARINREREIIAQERSIAATKDAAVMAFLQKLADQQQNPGQPPQNNNPIIPILSQPPPQPVSVVTPPLRPPVAAAVVVSAPAPPPRQPQPQPQPQPVLLPPPAPTVNLDVTSKSGDNGDQSYNTPIASSSRWPKVEVEALIKLRSNLDAKYNDSGPKGPLWEEISAAMKRLGYNRNAKRCKEKWENINKYFKKVKESNKKRPEDSKTCPYFHQLDALYREKTKLHDSSSVPLMVRPEQQWPPPPPTEAAAADQHNHQHDQDMESDQNQDEDDKMDDGDGDEEEDDEQGGDYEIVASKPVSMGT